MQTVSSRLGRGGGREAEGHARPGTSQQWAFYPYSLGTVGKSTRNINGEQSLSPGLPEEVLCTNGGVSAETQQP